MDLVLRALGALVAGFLFSQSAEFAQQYLQRLGGAADALGAVVERFEASAAAEGLSREAAVERLRDASDRFVARQGEDAAETIDRFEAVSRRYRKLKASAPLLRPFIVLSDPDAAVVARTAEDYRPALPTTVDGLVLTLAGVSTGWAGGVFAAAGVRARRRRKAARSAAAE